MRTFILPLTLMTLVTALSLATGQAIIQDDPAVAAARTRQESVKSVDVTFKRTEVVPKGGMSNKTPTNFPNRTVPAEDFTCESINHFVIGGEKARFDDNHPVWSNWFVPKPYSTKKTWVHAFNGATMKTWFPNGYFEKKEPSGVISTCWSVGSSAVILAPVTLTFAGLKPTIGFRSVAEMKTTGNILTINGSPCQERRIDRDGISTLFWLDPTKNHVVRRIRQFPFRKHVADTDVQYRLDESMGWVPTSWVRDEYVQGGPVYTTTKVDVVGIRFNESLPDELFEIQFPPGCEVHDQTYPNNGRNFRVQADGSLRELSPYGIELPLPETGQADSWASWKRWFPLAVVVSFAGVIYLFVVRKKRSNGV